MANTAVNSNKIGLLIIFESLSNTNVKINNKTINDMILFVISDLNILRNPPYEVTRHTVYTLSTL